MNMLASIHPATRFLVCAGSTRERLDRVRDWGNIFTGGTGFDIARALAAYGPVDLVTSNREHLALLRSGVLAAHPIHGFAFRAHADLRAKLAELIPTGGYAAISMSAAVSDYTPVGSFAVVDREMLDDGQQRWLVRDVQAGKVSSGHGDIAVAGKQTEKLIDLVRSTWGFAGLLVKFKLEVGIDTAALLAIGERSRQTSRADLLVANTLEMVEGDRPGAWLLGDGEPRWTDRRDLATSLAGLVASRLRIQATEVPRRGLAGQLAESCRERAALLHQISPAVYADRSRGSSVGEHVRHGLDHLHAIINGHASGLVDYDIRRRGWAGESDSTLAIGELDGLATRFDAIPPSELLRPLVVRCCVSPDQPAVELPTTLARELLFALSHETHHAAIISRLFEDHGVAVPAGFGVAASTIIHRASSCAASA